MSVRTRTHLTRSHRTRAELQTRKRRILWREVAQKEIDQFSEAGVMLRGCRYRKGITQLELSKATGIQQNHISEMENGKRAIGKEMAKRLAAFFKVDYRIFL